MHRCNEPNLLNFLFLEIKRREVVIMSGPKSKSILFYANAFIIFGPYASFKNRILKVKPLFSFTLWSFKQYSI